jgi:hypothetical protein
MTLSLEMAEDGIKLHQTNQFNFRRLKCGKALCAQTLSIPSLNSMRKAYQRPDTSFNRGLEEA